MAGVLNILIGVFLVAALVVALMRPRNDLDDPVVGAKNERLKKITGIILFCALAILAVKILMFN